MFNRNFLLLLLVFLFSIINSCSTGKYAATNKSYKQQVKAIAKTIRQSPLKDSFQLKLITMALNLLLISK
jgi:hypothetical protein